MVNSDELRSVNLSPDAPAGLVDAVRLVEGTHGDYDKADGFTTVAPGDVEGIPHGAWIVQSSTMVTGGGVFTSVNVGQFLHAESSYHPMYRYRASTLVTMAVGEDTLYVTGGSGRHNPKPCVFVWSGE